MNKPIKCGHCGRFIANIALEYCNFLFTPDSEYSTEESYLVCPRCIAKERKLTNTELFKENEKILKEECNEL